MAVKTKLWIVGKVDKENFLEWEFQGVFDTKKKAVSVCKDWTYFVGPVNLNEDRWHVGGTKLWSGAYYPIKRLEGDK